MKSVFIFLALLPVVASAQCLSGDCKNGTGKYDYGYAVYEGAFKNGEPHGQGTMDYGGGEKYVGGFAFGKEDGAGTLYKAGSGKAVTYAAGVLQSRPEQPVAVGGNPQKNTDANCTGDCYGGQGTYRFPSGNVYVGRFAGGEFQGQGKMTFASGNVLTGEFDKHIPQRGTFFYAENGTTFSGTFNEDGTPRTGSYTNPKLDGIVDVSNGVITSERHPKRDSINAEAIKHAAEFKSCQACGGKGEYLHTSWTSMSSKRSESTGWSPTGGYYTEVSYKSSGGFSQQMRTCPVCKGEGEVKR